MNPFRMRKDPYESLGKKRIPVVNTKLMNPYTTEGLNKMYNWKPGMQLGVGESKPLSAQTFYDVRDIQPKLKNPYTVENLNALYGKEPTLYEGFQKALTKKASLPVTVSTKRLSTQASKVSKKWAPVQTGGAKGVGITRSGYAQNPIKLPGMMTKQPVSTKPALSSKPTSSLRGIGAGLGAMLAGNAIQGWLTSKRNPKDHAFYNETDWGKEVLGLGDFIVPGLGTAAATVFVAGQNAAQAITDTAVKGLNDQADKGCNPADPNYIECLGLLEERKKPNDQRLPGAQEPKQQNPSPQNTTNEGTCQIMTLEQLKKELAYDPNIQSTENIPSKQPRGKGPAQSTNGFVAQSSVPAPPLTEVPTREDGGGTKGIDVNYLGF